MPNVKTPEDCQDFFEYCEKRLADADAGNIKISTFVKANMQRRLYDKPYSVLDASFHNFVHFLLSNITFKIRPLDPERHFLLKSFTNSEPLRYWIKSSIKLNDDPLIHAQIITYASDMFLAGEF